MQLVTIYLVHPWPVALVGLGGPVVPAKFVICRITALRHETPMLATQRSHAPSKCTLSNVHSYHSYQTCIRLLSLIKYAVCQGEAAHVRLVPANRVILAVHAKTSRMPEC